MGVLFGTNGERFVSPREREERFTQIIRDAFGDDENRKEPEYGQLNGKIKTWRDPYDMGFNTTTARQVQFEPGVTILIGCNGAGKTTLLNNIKTECQHHHVPCIDFDNLKDGGSRSVSAMFQTNNVDMAARLWGASEGEALFLNIGIFARDIGRLVQTTYKNVPELWLLLDASDSGLSIDNVLEVKELFQLILESNQDKQVYIVVASNEYELASGEHCMDVMSGKYRKKPFASYNAYKKFILKSREKKDKRYKLS